MTMLRHALAAVTANPSSTSRTRAASSSVGDIAPARARATPLSRAASFLQGGRVKVRTNALPAPAPRGRSAAPVTRALFGKKPASSPASTNVSVPITELTETCRRAIKTYGYDDVETQILLDVMMYAQLRGNNQGIIKVTTKGIARDPAWAPIAIEHETQLSACLNGNKNAGMVVIHKAMDMAIEKAKTHGFGICGTNNTSTSTGALGYYAQKIAEEGLIAMVFAGSPEFVAPNGAIQPIFGTNPIGVGIPTAGKPVVLDMATSAYSFFGLLEARTAGKKIPHGVAIDSAGKITEDPNAAIDGGAIIGFDGGYKSSNLALMVELLAGPLVGAAVTDKMAAKNWGNLVVAIDPKLLGQGEFERRAKMVTDRVKAAKRQPDVDEILLPGERGDGVAARARASGVIDVESNLWAGLQELASQWQGGVMPPVYGASVAGGAATAARGRKKSRDEWSMATKLVHPAAHVHDPFDSTNPPLYQTATFGQPSATENGPYDYTRSGNPTRDLLEKEMAALEGADRAFAFSSGMSALMCVTRLVKTGERIVTGDDIYGGTSRLLAQVVPKVGIEVVNVDMNDLDAVRRAVESGPTTMVMLESPTNPRLQITDIRRISEMAHAKGALVCVDNSMMAPVFAKPLELGADISMTSATKFISGQSDVTGGILAVKGEQLGKDIYFHQNAEGLHLGPFDCWLALRGIKTMALRMERQQENAMKMARWLEAHPAVTHVNYPGLESNKGHGLHKSQASGTGSILSFATGDVNLSKIVVEKTELFKITVSFGNTSSLISLPCFMSHASIPAEVRAARGLPDDLVRISAGIEDADDLIADLEEAFQEAMSATGWHSKNGGGSVHGNDGSAGLTDAAARREDELLRRIAALEAQLEGLHNVKSPPR
mmetsp:Transcript_11509/g.49595  ORF Transcript_11509/g.49595 Transcript_11509/m.49595 type:complete len:887 (-) Transcript_11509:40-2700(-)